MAHAYDPLRMRLTAGRGEYRVSLLELGESFGAGVGIQLTKLAGGTDPEADAYALFLADDKRHSTCECKGFLRWGRCCHLTAMTAEFEKGLVEDPRCRPSVPGSTVEQMEAEAAERAFRQWKALRDLEWAQMEARHAEWWASFGKSEPCPF